MKKMCSECKYATYDDSTGKMLIYCTRPRYKEREVDNWSAGPSRLFSPFKKLNTEACVLFKK